MKREDIKLPQMWEVRTTLLFFNVLNDSKKL